MEKKKIGLYIGVAQSFLIMLLVVMFIMLTSEVTKLEGTAKVINYAGVVRGGTELLVKEDLFGNTDFGFQENLDAIMDGLLNGGSKYELTKIEDTDYQNKLEQLNSVWTKLKAALEVYRDSKQNMKEVYDISQQHFVIADEAVMLAENYSENCVNTISLINKAVIAICVLLVITLIAQFCIHSTKKKEEA